MFHSFMRGRRRGDANVGNIIAKPHRTATAITDDHHEFSPARPAPRLKGLNSPPHPAILGPSTASRMQSIMKPIASRLIRVLGLGLVLAPASGPLTAAELNALTPKEKSDGWVLLFDGKTTQGWKNFKKDKA